MWTPTLAALVLSILPAARAVDIYLSPPPRLPHTLSADDATAVLSHHLGLEAFDALPGGDWVLDGIFDVPASGQKEQSVLLLTMDEVDVNEMRLPDSLRHVASLDSPPVSSLDSVISTYLHRAAHVYTAIFSPQSQSQSLSSFLSSTSADEPFFAAQELTALRSLRTTHGVSSPEYTTALADTRALIQAAIAQDVKIALLTFSSSPVIAKRQQPQPSQAPFPAPPPQQPIGSIGTCHLTLDACTNATSSCSGRGECLGASKAGRTCFVCACGKTTTTTTTGGKTRTSTDGWAGERCERKDVSGPFVLLAGTTIVLILVIAMSVGLLYGVGNIELPSVLLGGAVHKKD
ncbi:hypothetical protein C8F01DRAFT_1378051 [Mycena amicta]|nr:hypothetical protein C8F01DRAFT_1378051 [Mycena amicta]